MVTFIVKLIFFEHWTGQASKRAKRTGDASDGLTVMVRPPLLSKKAAKALAAMPAFDHGFGGKVANDIFKPPTIKQKKNKEDSLIESSTSMTRDAGHLMN